MSKIEVRHVLGISGGKDSAALALYLNKKYSRSDLPIEYYTCDTGKELQETYKLINQLENALGADIKRYSSIDHEALQEDSPFDVFLKNYGGYLPSQSARWCTKKMKLEPFEEKVGDHPVVSYVGIRGDEDREGYISTKPNIQSIFPFRKNIWSLDVTTQFLSNKNLAHLSDIYSKLIEKHPLKARINTVVQKPIDKEFQMKHKLDTLLDFGTTLYNHAVFKFLKGTDYPVGKLEYFPLINNEDVLVRSDIFKIIENSTVDLPSYYTPMEYEVDGEKGKYFRSRSGCFFCFYQQKIEWVWLLEKHKDLFWKAASYEKNGYSWNEGESLSDLARPSRVKAIKREHLNRMKRRYANLVKPTDWQDQILNTNSLSPSSLAKDSHWIDTLMESEGDLCANCFI